MPRQEPSAVTHVKAASDQKSIDFSVVVPLYNKGRHIERAIRSALEQDHAPAEIIVVDDGSIDDGLMLARQFPQVRIFERSPAGPGGYAARNLAIEQARHEWIAFLDADDEWQSDHLEMLARAIADSDDKAVLASTGYWNKHSETKILPSAYPAKRPQARTAVFSFAAFVELWLDLTECPVGTSAIAARRSALMAARMFPAGRCVRGGDKDLWLRVATLGPVVIDPTCSSTYHKDSDNMVTRAPIAQACVCLSETIATMLPTVGDRERPLLRRLRNLEIFKYALLVARRERIQLDTWRPFSFSLNPAKFLILAALSTPFGAAIGHRAARQGWSMRR